MSPRALRFTLFCLVFALPASAQSPAAPPTAVLDPAPHAATPPDATIAPPAPPAPPAPSAPSAEPSAVPALATTTSLSPPEDLLALGSDELSSALTGESPELQLYGFADFTYSALLLHDNNRWAQVYHPYASFAVGNLNLYLSSDLGSGWRALSEVRFTYLPHGNEAIVGGSVQRKDTTVVDYADFERLVEVGGVVLERVWLEYSYSALLTLRAGSWLTPYGIWNVDHGSPTIIATHRPFSVGEALFPVRQAGLELYGRHSFGASSAGYHLTLSNGRGPVEAYHDFDRNKAVGARLFLETRALPGVFTLGSSFYKGVYTDRAEVNTVDASSGKNVLSVSRPIVSQYHELSLAADLKWEWERLQVQGELIMNEAAFDTRQQKQGLDGPYLPADFRRWGVYGLAGYQLPWLPVMPYVMFEYYNATDRPEVPPALAYYGGLNIRPVPRVTLKAQVTYGTFDGEGSIGFGRDPIAILELQSAWSF